MENLKLVAFVAASSWLVGCIGTGTGDAKDDTGGTDTDSGSMTDDTDDTDMPVAGPPAWDTTGWANGFKDALELACTGDGSTGTVNVILRTENWGNPPIELYFAGTRFTAGGAYDEDHTLDETDQSATSDGYSVFERELSTKAVPNTPDVSTLFRCDAFDPDSTNYDVTVAAVVSDSSGAYADCIVFGQNPDALLNKSIAGLSYPSWLTSSCHNGNM